MAIWGNNTKRKSVSDITQPLSSASNLPPPEIPVTPRFQIVDKRRDAPVEPPPPAPVERKMRVAVPLGVALNGQLSFDTSARVEGDFSGTLHCGGTLVVGESSNVHDATLVADVVVVRGSMTGKIRAVKRIEIARGGSFVGMLDTPALAMEEGATLNSEQLAIGG